MYEVELKSISSNDFVEWDDFLKHLPADPFDECGWFDVTIGEVGVRGGNDFQVLVSTTKAIKRARSGNRRFKGIVVDEFTPSKVTEAIERAIKDAASMTWDETLSKLREFGDWEYDGM